MAKSKSRNPLARYSPWSWALEPVQGCNLKCGHCCARLLPNGEFKFITKDTWSDVFKMIRTVTPRSRVEMAQCGEPTLHPDMLDLLWIARKLSPQSQIQITTNGTMLAKGELTYRDLFKSGVNIVYVDMYDPKEKHIELARESGIQFYEYLNRPKNAPGAWTYHSADIKLIVLMEPPIRWPKSRKGLNRLGTFFNHMDWKAAEKFGMKPVEEPIARRCTQPYRYVVVNHSGAYLLCCQDFTGETEGMFGSVSDGLEGFKRFWFGKVMQGVRRKLRDADRASIPWCSRCDITFSRSDYRMWDDQIHSRWWDGERWISFDENGGSK